MFRVQSLLNHSDLVALHENRKLRISTLLHVVAHGSFSQNGYGGFPKSPVPFGLLIIKIMVFVGAYQGLPI